MVADQIKTAVHCAEHTQSQNIDLQQTQGFDIVFIPLNHRTFSHAGVFHWDQSADRTFGNNKTAHMLGEMAGKTEDLIEQFKKVLGDLPLAITALLLKQCLKICLSVPPRHGLAELLNKQCIQPQGFAHIAHRAAGSVADHRGSQSGPFAAVFFVDILNYLFPALMLKVHVYIRWLVAFSGDKAFEQ